MLAQPFFCRAAHSPTSRLVSVRALATGLCTTHATGLRSPSSARLVLPAIDATPGGGKDGLKVVDQEPSKLKIHVLHLLD